MLLVAHRDTAAVDGADDAAAGDGLETVDVRERQVANLRNVDEDLATAVATGLGMVKLPPRSQAAR